MERDATRSEDLRIAGRDAAASLLVAILGVALALGGAKISPAITNTTGVMPSAKTATSPSA